MRIALAVALMLVACSEPKPAPPAAAAKVEAAAAAPAPAADAGPPVFKSADGGVLDGEALFKQRTCLACHGKDAKTPILPNYPRVAGQMAAYAEQQMRDIKSGARANGMTAAMKGIMPLVPDEEIPALAHYLSTLDPIPSAKGAAMGAFTDGGSKLDGAALFVQKTCPACHGKDAKTPILPNYPNLVGQSAIYAEQQMKDIRGGVRANGQTAAMKAIIASVNDEEIHALAEYLHSLK
jgi:cytochrome c553